MATESTALTGRARRVPGASYHEGQGAADVGDPVDEELRRV